MSTSPGGSNSVKSEVSAPQESTDSGVTTQSQSSTTTVTDSDASEPGPGARWIPMTVENPSSTRTAPSGTSVKLTLDHAALVSVGFRSDGQDLRICSVRGATQTQLDRVLGPESAWGRSDTAIWFKIDSDFTRNQSEPDVYHLVLDPNMSPPARDPQEAFLFFDDFNAPNPGLNRWSVEHSGVGGDSSAEVTGGQFVLSARSTSNNVVRTEVRTSQSFSVPGIVVEASVGWDGVSGRDGCTEETVIGLWSPGEFHKRALWNRRDDEWYFGNRTSTESVRYQRLSSQPINGNPLRHTAYWVDHPFSMYIGTEFVGKLNPTLTAFESPADGALHLGFSAGAGGAICSRTSRVRVDWVLARLADSAIDVATTLRFSDEFVQP